MINLIMIANIVTCVCAFGGFAYGSIKFFRPRKAIYPQMITLAVGCMAFGRLYQVIRLLTHGEIYGEFQLGVLGVIGSLLFLFSANYGAMDGLADDGSKEYRKYRLIALAVPAAVAALYFLFVFGPALPLAAQIIYALITILAMGAGYYHLKHLIFPDVDYGLIKYLRAYNLTALVYAFLCVAEMIAIGIRNEICILIVGVLMGANLVAIIIAAERGIKKWTI